MPDLFLSVKPLHILAVIIMVGATVINGAIHTQARVSTPAAAAALLGVLRRINTRLLAQSLLIAPAMGLWMIGQLGL
ncbi:hypothetical protein [Pseudophaeobacter sp.]|uniref:hypothetical protein n=1 Tax=Pseudophaeobacter sp. TaxID=1971739 RepID=UPI003298F24B